MAPPAAKRRKLSHSDSSEEDAASFSDSDLSAINGVEEDFDDASSDEVDDSMEDTEDVEGGQSMDSEDEEDLLTEDDASESKKEEHINTQPAKLSQVKREQKTGKRRDEIPQDGVYTAEVYKSNMFKLQVDELLEQVRPKYAKKEAPAENAMRTLKAIIEGMPSREPLSIHDAERSLLKSSKVAVPFPHPRPPREAKYKLQYDRPASINATGSYPLKIATRAGEDLAIDLVVTMPMSLFQEKDYLNHRYFYKRAYYLACIAAGITDSKEHKFKITFDCLNGNHLQPIIVVNPSGDGSPDDFSGSKCRIQIIPTAADKTFSTEKLLPEKNCIRPKNLEENSSSTKLTPTPFYNATLQADCSVTAYLKLLHAASSQCDAYKDACLLGRIWLRQRGFNSQIRKGGFGNFEWAAVMAVLLQSNPGAGVPLLSAGYSSYQLFKATLQFLANRDLAKAPFLFQAKDINIPKSDGNPVFFDGPRNINILFKMTPWSYKLLQQEASMAVKMLADSTFDQFEPTFIIKADPLLYRYDGIVNVPLSSLNYDFSDGKFHEKLSQTCQKLYSTLVRGLGDRVTSISILLPEGTSWQVGSAKPSEDREGRILVGFITDPANAARTVDHGPPAENKKEAASFRQFWGEKAELRRFKDGSILESVVWSQKEGGESILGQIVKHLLRRHISAEVADNSVIASDQFARLLSSGRLTGQSGTATFLPLMNAFSALEKEIRGLDGLPLQIRHILAADPQLRYSSINVPSSNTGKYVTHPASIIVQFEGSGRWPDDLAAIQRTKVAFLLKLSSLLSEINTELTTRVGLENPSQPFQNQSFLDIITPLGPAFRLRIHHDREATLLERKLKDKALDGPSREAAALALAAHKCDFLRAPAHTQAMQTLCTRFPALSPSLRLVKKWFAAHLLTPHFAPETIELIVARTFLHPHPWTPPASASTALLRTLLFLSRWDWRHVPLIVDFSAATDGAATGMTPEQLAATTTRFDAWRRIDPALNRVVLFAASSLDADGATWTDRARPPKVVAARMTALARAAVAAAREWDAAMARARGATPELRPETLFVSALDDYDFVLRLRAKFTRAGRARRGKKGADGGVFRNLQLQAEVGEDVKLVGYDPVALFLGELQQIYGHAVIWFYDVEGGDVVAGLWNPATTARRGWKVRVGYSSVPMAGEKSKREEREEGAGVEVEINKEGILAEIARLGGELIERVEVVRK